MQSLPLESTNGEDIAQTLRVPKQVCTICRRERYNILLTIKDLKLIILLLTEEVLYCDGDVIFGLHFHQPRAGLELRIASRVALTQDNACGVCQKLICWAVHLEKEKRNIRYMRWKRRKTNTCAFSWCKRQQLENQYLSTFIQDPSTHHYTAPRQEMTSDSVSTLPYC